MFQGINVIQIII